MKITDDLDTKGLLCPLPVLKARKRLLGMAVGDVLRVVADDPVAVVDFPHFCGEAGHDLLSAETTGTVHVFVIRKGHALANL
jgi:tRNA 2-thiouridine synthesizing protein A